MPILKNIVISGGGISGIGFLGILLYLEENKLLCQIDKYVGTSAGSLISFLLSINYTCEEIFHFIYYFDFNKFVSDISLDNFFENYGFEDNNKLIYTLKRLIEVKGVKEDITFIEHFNKFNKKLYITGSCINENKIYYFNYLDNPNMKILDAIKISTCIPLVFSPINYENKLWLDGGLIDNYPINICADEIENTIGITIYDDCIDNLEDNKINSVIDFLSSVVKCSIYGDNFKNYRKYERNTIKFSGCFSSYANFKIDKEEKKKLYDSGYSIAEEQSSKLQKFIDSLNEDIINESVSSISETEKIQKIAEEVNNISDDSN